MNAWYPNAACDWAALHSAAEQLAVR